MPITTISGGLLDALDEAPGADVALREVDWATQRIAGPSIFSIQLNVTTADDPANEVRLQRFYSSASERWPVSGVKRKTLTPWTRTLFLQCRPFIGEGVEALAAAFDDYDKMKAIGLRSVINVPLLRGNLCYATFNVFATRDRWQGDELLGIRLLALTAQRWVTPAAGLTYNFDCEAAAPAG